MTSLVPFFIALGILVFVHELGHFLVAKRAGIRVERFSLGLGPKIIGFRWGDTEYCVSWVPFGGYVKVAGMADVGTEEATGADWEFPSKSVGVRMAVIVAGPVMNFLFAFVAFVVLFITYGVNSAGTTVAVIEGSIAESSGIERGDRITRIGGIPVAFARDMDAALQELEGQSVNLEVDRGGQLLTLTLPPLQEDDELGLKILDPALVGFVVEGKPATIAGLQEGDRVLSVAGQRVHDWPEMREAIIPHPGEAIDIEWERNDEIMRAVITPEISEQDGEPVGLIGIGRYRSRASVSLTEASELAILNVYTSSYLILDFIGQVFEEERYKELGGPIRIAKMANDTAERGVDDFIGFLALLSVNLAILNLLPIPVLDGGHLFFLALEAILPHPLSLRQREVAQQLGLWIILGIMALVCFNDLNQLVFPYIVDLFQ
ncbi:MAG: RIP metalloprotease RseP [Candidatus Latescibacterota bacterium]|nr:RIP metalloprotease RseP [Candidatus Latescibacterota bacterium]